MAALPIQRRLLITHGDSFDSVVLYAKWLALLGDKAYSLLLRTNIVVNAVRRQFKLPYWSLSAHIKKRVKNAVQFICAYEEAVARETSDRGLDGVVCGHIHSAVFNMGSSQFDRFYLGSRGSLRQINRSLFFYNC